MRLLASTILLSLATLLPDFTPYNPAQPLNPSDFRWTNSPFFDSVKPEGN